MLLRSTIPYNKGAGDDDALFLLETEMTSSSNEPAEGGNVKALEPTGAMKAESRKAFNNVRRVHQLNHSRRHVRPTNAMQPALIVVGFQILSS